MSSVIDDILKVVVVRLQAITTANGYPYDIGLVQRPNRTGDYRKHNRDIVVTYNDPEPNDELSCQGNPPRIARDMMIRCCGHIRQSDHDASPLDALQTELGEAMGRAIASPDHWYTFDGLCIESMLMGIKKTGIDTDDTAGVELHVETTYRVSEFNIGQLA